MQAVRGGICADCYECSIQVTKTNLMDQTKKKIIRCFEIHLSDENY